MATIVKERAPGARKKAGKRSPAKDLTLTAPKQKKPRKAAARKMPNRPIPAGTERDMFGEDSIVSPRIGQGHIHRSSLILAPTQGQYELLVSNTTAPQAGPRHRLLYLLLLLVTMGIGFGLGRLSYPPVGAPVDIQTQAPAGGTGAVPVADAVTPPPTVASAMSKPKATVASAMLASIKAKVVSARHAPETALREVSVGTSSRGGLTLKFDRPVSWTLHDNGGRGEAEVDIEGVRNLGTFPRNLPLPPGVMVIHAAIKGPDTLRLWFTLLPNLRAFSSPEGGPSQILNVYFRTDSEGSAAPALPEALQRGGG